MVVEWFLETTREYQVFGSFRRQKWRRVRERGCSYEGGEREQDDANFRVFGDI